MPSSVIVAARRYAIEELSALLPQDVLPTYAWKPDARDRHQVFTMRARGETPPAALKSGRNHRQETARFVVVIHVHEVGEAQDVADDHAIELGLIVEEFFADNKSPGDAVPGLNWWVVEGWEMDGGQADRASVAQLLYTIRYDARLT